MAGGPKGSTYDMETFDSLGRKQRPLPERSQGCRQAFFLWHNTTRITSSLSWADKYQGKMTYKTNYCLEEAAWNSWRFGSARIMRALDAMGRPTTQSSSSAP